MPAPIAPSKNERDKVIDALAAAKASADDAAKALDALDRRKRDIHDNVSNKTPVWLRWRLNQEIESAIANDPEYARLKDKALIARLNDAESHNRALSLTVAIYGLTPPTADFHGDSRAATTNMVARRWLPHYSEWETQDSFGGQWRKRTPLEIQEERRRQGAPTGAITIGDGEIRIFGNAFDDPDDLATLIFHETSHWVDVAGKSGGFRNSDPPYISFRTEQNAYERQAAFAAQLGKDPTWLKAQADRYRLQAEVSIAEKLQWKDVKIRHPDWIGTDRKGMLGSVPPASDVSAGDEELLSRKMAEMKKSVDEARDYQKRIEEVERQGREAHPIEIHPTFPGQDPPGYVRIVPTRPGEGPKPVRGIRVDNGLYEMAEALKIARQACADPISITDAMVAEVDWSRLLKSDPDRFRTGLSPCESRVFDREVAFARSWTQGAILGATAIRDAVAEPVSAPVGNGGSAPSTPSHDPVWERVRPIIPH